MAQRVRRRVCTAIVLLLAQLIHQPSGHAQSGDALPFSKGFLVSGNYLVGAVDLNPKNAVNGFVSGTISMSGVPADGEIVAAFLYWEMITTDIAQVDGAQFRGSPLTVVKASTATLNPSIAPCWSSGGGSAATYTMTMFRADVLHLLPFQLDANGQPNGRRLVNDADLTSNGLPLTTVTLPNGNAGNQVPSAAGATLFVVYRSASQPLTKIVLYDGISVQAPGATMHQTIRGFYQSASSKSAKMTQIVGSSSPNSTEQVLFNGSVIAANPFIGSNSPQSNRAWSSPTWDVTSLMPGKDLNTGFGEEVSTAVTHGKTSPYDCLTWAAVIFSTRVQDTDADGIPDKLEDVSGLSDPDGSALPDFRAMGASSMHKDFFVEVGAMKAVAGTTYGSASAPLNADVAQAVDPAGHNHLPTPAVLKLVGDAAKNAPVGNPDGLPGINAHFDVGPNYHGVDLPNYSSTVADEYVIGSDQARGGESIKEVSCDPAATPSCQFPAFPGTVNWKAGFQVYRDAPVAADGSELGAADENACEAAEFAGTGICRHRFDRNRRDYFHYVLYSHARGVPKSTDRNSADFHVPRGSSGTADLPGGDAMVSLGFWDNFVASEFMQAATTMHELGHNFWRRHGGDSNAPNCNP